MVRRIEDIESFCDLVTQALDRSRKAISEKNKQRAELIRSVKQLGHYVEIKCDNDPTAFLSSGFEAASTIRTPASPLPPASILKVVHGVNGELLVFIKPLPGARRYDLRYAAIPAGSLPETWIIDSFCSARRAVSIEGLTPGANYLFQVRAFGAQGYTDWSDPVSRICA